MTTKDTDRYMAAMHGMQSGVAYEMNVNAEPTSPKHLRVGINASAVNQAALAELLMAKGIFTLDEYHAALADAAENEKARYEAHLSSLMGRKVTLA